MRRYIHAYDSGVWVDACSDHGIWLDPGELERLEAMAEAARRGGSIQPTELGQKNPERGFLKEDPMWRHMRGGDDFGYNSDAGFDLF
jgi:Zn-finger nucleic acid-binding protein